MDALESSFLWPRRRRTDGGESLPKMKRTASSTPSSDILVASAQTFPPHQRQNLHPEHRQQPLLMARRDVSDRAWADGARTTASVTRGHMLNVRFASSHARTALRSILRHKPKPLSSASNTSQISKQPIGDEDDAADVDGPNHRGTYSRAHVLRHPEINWVHRGQGRYLPATDVKESEPVESKTDRRTKQVVFVSEMFTMDDIDEMFMQLAYSFDTARRKANPNAKENWSPSLKHQYTQIVTLLGKTRAEDWGTLLPLIKDQNSKSIVRDWLKQMHDDYAAPANDAISEQSSSDEEDQGVRTRQSRQTRAVPSIEARRSSRLVDAPQHSFSLDDEEDEDDNESYVSDEEALGPKGTYKKAYVDQHPDEEFYHAGNGWYKRGPRPTPLPAAHISRRRESAISAVVKCGNGDAPDLSPNDTVKWDQLHYYPGQTFHHTGNGYYKLGIGTYGRKASVTVDLNGVPISNKHLRDEDDGLSVDVSADFDATVDKEYTLLHPDIEWVHRGGGRYKRKSSAITSQTAALSTPSTSIGRRSSKVEDPFTDVYSHDYLPIRSSARPKRGPRLQSAQSEERIVTQPIVSSADSQPNDIDDLFYTRAQRRLGRSLQHQHNQPRTPVYHNINHGDMVNENLFDSEYVNAHPDETFHHRGQGRWARGLPPPGSSNKTAVRGPGAKDRTQSVSSRPSRTTEEVDEDGNPPPGLLDLVYREDGPEKWPGIEFFYRGGGKWCRTPNPNKGKQTVVKRPQPTIVKRARGDGAEAQLQREARAAEVQQVVKVQQRVPFPRRKAEPIQRIVSKASSNKSEAPTPRPALLPDDEDILTDNDFNEPYTDDWPSDDEGTNLDEADMIYRRMFKPLNDAELFVNALTKHDPAVRSLSNLNALALNSFAALKALQDEYLEIDQIVALEPMLGKKERKPVTGGRAVVEKDVFEDKKEALLYDYTFDSRRVGWQDPDAQRIIRDEEGRELRRRRKRQGIDITAAVQALEAGGDELGADDRPVRRTLKRAFENDMDAESPSPKKARLTNDTMTPDMAVVEEAVLLLATPSIETKAASVISDRSNTPLLGLVNPEDYVAPTSGRWKGHVPKRIQELRGESVASNRSETGSPKPTGGVRKGRPPGSKNLHKRKDAGIKKGPRKPKPVVPPAEGGEVSEDGGQADGTYVMSGALPGVDGSEE